MNGVRWLSGYIIKTTKELLFKQIFSVDITNENIIEIVYLKNNNLNGIKLDISNKYKKLKLLFPNKKQAIHFYKIIEAYQDIKIKK
jgi:hypothetical protein